MKSRFAAAKLRQQIKNNATVIRLREADMTPAEVLALKSKQGDPMNAPLDVQDKPGFYTLTLTSVDGIIIPEQFKNKPGQNG
jgi:hypothetical protein